MSTLKVDTIESKTINGNITVSSSLVGDGSGLTNLPAANLTGFIADARIPESAVTQHVTPFDPAQIEMNQAILAFKIASSNQLAKFQMVDQVIDE